MNYINLPGTDLNISKVSFGTWGIAGPPFWKSIDFGETIHLLQKAHDSGINFFDTAPVYGFGNGEIMLQSAFGSNPDIFIATKVGLRWRTEDRRTIYHDLGAKSIRWEIEQSLKRLKRDQVDLYQVHWPDPNTSLEETFSTLEAIKAEGKIRHIGVSNFSVEQIIVAKKYATIATAQPRYNYLDQKAAASLLPYCEKNKIGTLIYSPLASGLLTGKYDESSTFDDWRGGSFADQFTPEKRSEYLAKIAKLKDRADKNKMSLTQYVLEWTLQQKGVSSLLIGFRKESHLTDPLLSGRQQLKPENLIID